MNDQTLPVSSTVSSAQLDGRHVVSYHDLMSPAELRKEIEPGDEQVETVLEGRRRIRAALAGEDDRMVVVVGPCSVHDPDAALEYARRLRTLRDELDEHLIVVMRTYFEKPRTSVGWKGLIYDPHLDGSSEAAVGLRTARQVLLDVTALKLPCAVEVLDTVTPQYYSDLVSWAAIGARTVESQVHRQLASGMSMPVGFKNGTDGRLAGAVNGVAAAVSEHSFFGIDPTGRAAVVRTDGNPDAHVVLRGGVEGPNHDAATVADAAERTRKVTSHRRPVMVDCSHENSGKDQRRQRLVVEEMLAQWQDDDHGVLGLMLESNLGEGRQDWEPGRELQRGVSITDACVDWEETDRLLRACADHIAAQRG